MWHLLKKYKLNSILIYVFYLWKKEILQANENNHYLSVDKTKSEWEEITFIHSHVITIWNHSMRSLYIEKNCAISYKPLRDALYVLKQSFKGCFEKYWSENTYEQYTVKHLLQPIAFYISKRDSIKCAKFANFSNIFHTNYSK